MKKTNRSQKVPYQRNRVKSNIIDRVLPTKTINRIARQTGFMQREGGKISAKNLTIGFMKMVSKGINTFAGWASEISVLTQETITRQAIDERMTPQTQAMLKELLKEKLIKDIKYPLPVKIKGTVAKFTSIKLEDSTTLALPDEAAEVFPGSVSKGKQKSQAKIHALFDFTKNNFSFLNLHSFSDNDQGLAKQAIAYLEEGDLLIRDRGFFVLDALEQLMEKNVFFISRKDFKVKIYEESSEEEINLVQTLRKRKYIDQEVLVGSNKKLKMRLIAIALPAPQAAERRRKAREDRDKRLNHNSEYYELLGYAIYLTNVPQEYCQSKEIDQLYRLRWRIEIIFKTWKTCFSLQGLIHRQCTNPVRIACTIYLMLLYIYLFQVVWFNLYQGDASGTEQPLSIMKMAKFFRQHFALLVSMETEKFIKKLLNTHCRYDQRRDRKNSMEMFYKMAA